MNAPIPVMRGRRVAIIIGETGFRQAGGSTASVTLSSAAKNGSQDQLVAFLWGINR